MYFIYLMFGYDCFSSPSSMATPLKKRKIAVLGSRSVGKPTSTSDRCPALNVGQANRRW